MGLDVLIGEGWRSVGCWDKPQSGANRNGRGARPSRPRQLSDDWPISPIFRRPRTADVSARGLAANIKEVGTSCPHPGIGVSVN
jgi:hypothetical protein